MALNLEQLKKSYNILTKEFNNNMTELYGTWEGHQMALILGFLKDTIKAMQEPNGLIKANAIYKKIKDESKL